MLTSISVAPTFYYDPLKSLILVTLWMIQCSRDIKNGLQAKVNVNINTIILMTYTQLTN